MHGLKVHQRYPHRTKRCERVLARVHACTPCCHNPSNNASMDHKYQLVARSTEHKVLRSTGAPICSRRACRSRDDIDFISTRFFWAKWPVMSQPSVHRLQGCASRSLALQRARGGGELAQSRVPASDPCLHDSLHLSIISCEGKKNQRDPSTWVLLQQHYCIASAVQV